MKAKITLLTIIFFLTIFSFGQRKEHKDYKSDKRSIIVSQLRKFNRGENNYSIGSNYIKNRSVFQNSKNSQQKISSPSIIKHRLDNETAQYWDETLSQWIDSWKTEYTYDIQGNLTQTIDSGWDGNQWYKSYKTEYTYDINGNITEYFYYDWDGNQWFMPFRIEYTYDTNGNLTQDIGYYWDGSQLSMSYTSEYTYDANWNLTEYISHFWDGSQWYYIFRTTYTYDANGNLIQYTEYYWNWGENQWDNDIKAEYTYDSNENMIQYIDYDWHWDINQWINVEKTEFAYDTNKNLTYYFNYYDWDGNQWTYSWKTELNYNNSYSLSDLILPYFLPFIFNDIDIDIFFNQMLINSEEYWWDDTLNDWKIAGKYVFSYSEQEILSVSEMNLENIKIYPNPVSNVLTIKSETNPIDKVEIYSILGKKIKEINFDFENINTGDLSKGIYLLRINSEKGTTIKKLIKK